MKLIQPKTYLIIFFISISVLLVLMIILENVYSISYRSPLILAPAIFSFLLLSLGVYLLLKMKRKRLVVAIGFIVILFFMVFVYDSLTRTYCISCAIVSPVPPAPASQKVIPQEEQTSLPALSEEELTALWANGERCPETKIGFSVPSKEEDIVILDDGVKVFVNEIDVIFVDEATCEDAERIAILINGKIIGFGPTTNLYSFRIPTRTVEELNTAVETIRNLNDPKIEGVSRSYPIGIFLP